jgi:hypothetical protein
VKDIKNDIKVVPSLYSLLKTVAVVGDVGVDRAGFEGATVEVTAGVIATGTTPVYTFGVRECATLGGSYTVVAAADLIGSAIVFTPADANKVKTIGYIGSKQFIRVDLETVGGTAGTGGVFTGNVILGLARHNPVVQA